MKHNVKFIQEKRYKDGKLIIKDVPINAKITYNTFNIVYFTGYRINSDKFSIEKQEITKNAKGKQGKRDVYDNEINNVLTQIKSKLINLFSNTNYIDIFKERENKTIIEQGKNLIKSELDIICNKFKKPELNEVEKDLFYYLDIYINSAEFSPSRFKSAKSYKKNLYNYSLHKNITLTFENCTDEVLTDFEAYLREDNPPKGTNSIKTIMSFICTFWNYSIANFDGLNIPYPFKRRHSKKGYSIPAEIYADPIYISIAERDLIFNANIDNKDMDIVRDIFVFACLIGARVGALTKLTKNHIDKNNILTYIQNKRKKNEQPLTAKVPLSPKAIEILKKYKLPDNRILPFISDQKYNDYLKELFKFVGINRKVEVLNKYTNQPEHILISDLVSSHLARRTFVGNLINKKVEMQFVTPMSGHVAGSKAVQRYYKVSDSNLKDAIKLID